MNKFKKEIKKIEGRVISQVKLIKESEAVTFVASNPYVSIGGVLILVTVISTLFPKKKKTPSNDKLEKICEEIGLVHHEKTDIPVMGSGGKQALDEHGRKVFVVNKYVPVFDFSGLPKHFMMSKIHKTSVANLYNFINGLLIKLKSEGFIENGAGSINPTGLPGEFVINLYDKKKLDEIALFKKIQWYREETINGIKRDYFPEVQFTEDEMVTTLPKELNINDEIIKRGIESVEKFYNIALKPKFEISKDGRHIFFKVNPKMVQHFAKKHIAGSFDLWIEKVVTPMKKFWDENLIETFCFGENIDKTVTLDDNIIVETMANAPHVLNFGATRSGKTKTCSSIVVSIKQAYPRTLFYFADGKKSADYVEMASRFSPLPLAGLPPEQESDDPLIELANIVKEVYDKYIERVHLFQEVKTRYPVCSTYQDFNKYTRDDKTIPEDEKEDRYIRRIVLVLDEFGLFMKASMVDPTKLANVKNSVFWMLNTILRAGASYGISVILNTQRYQVSDMTSEMRSQLVVWLIHQVGLSDANQIGVRELIGDLSPGQFLLKSPGIKCKDTGKEFIKCTSPYIGDGKQFSDLLNQEFPNVHVDKKGFDYSLIYAQQDEESFDKIKSETIQKYIKQVFLLREGYELVWEKSARTNFICIRADDPRTGKKYAIGILDYEEIADQEFLKRLERESFPELKSCVKLFFLSGKIGGKVIDVQTNIASYIGETYLLSPLDYKRNLLQAIDLYNEKDESPLFEKCFDYKIDKTFATDIYEDTGAGSVDKVINAKALEILTEIKDTNEKGKAFEKWYQAYERKLGYDTLTVDELKKTDLLDDIFCNPQADGGIDLVRFVGPREDKKIIAIQCKNQISKNLDVAVVSRAVASRVLYQEMGFDVIDFLIVTTGDFTKQSRSEASHYKVKLINRTQLDSMIEEFYGRSVQGATEEALLELAQDQGRATIQGFGDATYSKNNEFYDGDADGFLNDSVDDDDDWYDDLVTPEGADPIEFNSDEDD